MTDVTSASFDTQQAGLRDPRARRESTHTITAQDSLPLLALPPGEARDCLAELHMELAKLAKPGLKIYEAGGGSTSYLPPLLLESADITVVDIDAHQIRSNHYARTKIVGDIQIQRFPKDSFDLIICYNVIEHLRDVEAALDRFRDSLKPGGLILIGAPIPQSLSGFVTRHTPHWFHTWYYRYVRGEKQAGLPGRPPFHTIFHPLVALPRLEQYAASHGLSVVYRRVYESPRYQEMRLRMPRLATTVDMVARCINLFAPVQRDVRHGDYHLILRKG